MKSDSKFGKQFEKTIKNRIKIISKSKPILTFLDGSKYFGMFKKDPKNNKKILAHGFGLSKWPDGQCYEGQYENGNFHGWGKYTVPNSHILIGLWKKGFMSEGEMRWKDGRHYNGSFKKSKYHGYGVMNYSGNILYAGDWKNGLADGKGRLTILKTNENDKKGTILKGTFKKGIQQGKFEKIFPNGTVMDCIFVNSECKKAKWRNQKKWTVFK